MKKLKYITIAVLFELLIQCQPNKPIELGNIQANILDLWVEKNGDSGGEYEYGTLSGFCLLIKKKGSRYLVWSASGDRTFLFQFNKLHCNLNTCSFSESQKQNQPEIMTLKFMDNNRFQVVLPAGHHVSKNAYYVRAPKADVKDLLGCGHNLDKQFPSLEKL